MQGGVLEVYADLFKDIDEQTQRRIAATLAGPLGQLPDRHEVRDFVDRVTGRISFEEYLRRGRRRPVVESRSPYPT
jgi:hypothetical protein